MEQGKPNRPLHEEYSGRVLTVQEVATILRVDEATVRRYIRDGLLEVLNMPAREDAKRHIRRIKGRSLDKIIGNQEDTGAS